jgi:large subunit ribosomal protein L31
MKAEGHPDYHFIDVVMTDGTRYRTRSTYAAEGAELHLEVDPKTHPAWTGAGHQISDKGRVSKFNEKFKGFFGKK